MLCGLLRVKAAGAPRRLLANGRAVLLLPLILASLLLAPSLAQASFTRPFERSLTRAEEPTAEADLKPCTEAEATASASTCLQPGGLAIQPEVLGGTGRQPLGLEPRSAQRVQPVL